MVHLPHSVYKYVQRGEFNADTIENLSHVVGFSLYPIAFFFDIRYIYLK